MGTLLIFGKEGAQKLADFLGISRARGDFLIMSIQL